MLELFFFIIFALLIFLLGLVIFGWSRRKSTNRPEKGSRETPNADAFRKAENSIGTVVDSGLDISSKVAETLGLEGTAEDLLEESSSRKDKDTEGR